MTSLILKTLLGVGTLVAAAPSNARRQTSGCGLAPPPSTVNNFTTATITVNSVDGARTYAFWIPANYDENTPTPLITSYHGAKEDIAKQRALDGLTETFFNPDHIVVYFQGTDDPAGNPSWEGSPGVTADDLGFTSAVLDVIESQFCVDSNRVYATGKSDGGGFVNLMACDHTLSTRIAAFAPVSGAYYNLNINTSSACTPQTIPLPCKPGRSNIPILAFHGGADPTIPYEGKFSATKKACLPAIPHWIEQWALLDGLSDVPMNVSIPKSVNGVNSTFGGVGGIVELVYDGDNIPHDWPATFNNSDNRGANLTSFDATTWIMGYFNAHSL